MTTVDDARLMACPFTFCQPNENVGDCPVNYKCAAERCMAWRWTVRPIEKDEQWIEVVVPAFCVPPAPEGEGWTLDEDVEDDPNAEFDDEGEPLTEIRRFWRPIPQVIGEGYCGLAGPPT